MPPAVRLEDVSKGYLGSSLILEHFDLVVQEGDFLVLYGPSGVGKTTLLNLIGGIDSPSSGTVVWGSGCAPEVGFVFQNCVETLFPWLTNSANIEMPLRMGKHASMSRESRRRRVSATITRLKLDIPLAMHPFEMSGGGKQKIALARALVSEPQLLLLDEPFNSLDLEDRDFMHSELVRIWQDLGVTVVMVTHDLDEAITIGSSIAVIGGRPARLVAEPVRIDLSYPRDSTVKLSVAYHQMRADIMAMFEFAKNETVTDAR